MVKKFSYHFYFSSFLFLFSVGFLSSAYAFTFTSTEQGIYVGGQVGDGKPDYGDIFSNTMSTVPNHHAEDNGLMGRIYLGYQFNPYLGAETGYSILSDNTYASSNPVTKNHIKLIIETEVWDILVTAGMPFGNTGFRGDIQAGAAYVMSVGNLSSNIPGFNNSASENNWSPAAGIKLSYNFSKNLSGELSYLHVCGSPDIDKNLDANIGTIAVGIRWKFV